MVSLIHRGFFFFFCFSKVKQEKDSINRKEELIGELPYLLKGKLLSLFYYVQFQISICLSKNRLPRWLSGVKNAPAMQEMQVQSLGRKIPWRRKWQPIPVFLPGKSHGQRSLVGYSPWGWTEHNLATKQQI